MIVVVEGPSAPGKTTWSRAHAASIVVPETPPTDPPADADAAAKFWAAHGAARWDRALELERTAGTAVCDSDPLKLHYAWSLWRVGEGSETEFLRLAAAYREAMAGGRIGFADCYLVEIPDRAILEARRMADVTRRRRNFGLHSLLGAPLREWYGMIEQLRPGSVRWELPDDGVGSLSDGDAPRHDVDALDSLIAQAGGWQVGG